MVPVFISAKCVWDDITVSTHQMPRHPARPYPHLCNSCGEKLKDKQAFYNHYNRYKLCPSSKAFNMSSVEKKIKGDNLSFALVPFHPREKLSSELATVLNKILEVLNKTKRKTLENMEVWFDDFDVAVLNKLKNFLDEKKLEYANKQDVVRNRVDDLLAQCSMVFRQEIETLLQSEMSLEKMLINHIRQRNLSQLETSAKLIEVIYITVMQTKLFKEVEETMKTFALLENMLTEYIKNSSPPDFIHSEGVLVSQQLDMNPDDLTEGY